jgi:predicted RND superfamily exporter protein
MPKKSAAARSGVQPQRARGQKSFELVLPEVATDESEATRDEQVEAPLNEQFDDTPAIAAAPKQAKNSSQKVKNTSAIATATREAETKPEAAPTTVTNTTTSTRPSGAPKSASARLAARRQATLKAQQRTGAAMITPEHFSYVRRDLITIAVLACIMFIAIFVLYFVLL